MSSSSFNNLARALSPSLDAIANAVISATINHGDNDNLDSDNILKLSNELVAALHSKITAARSVDNVIDCVYPDYRVALRTQLLEFASWSDKMHTCKDSLTRLSESIAKGTIPQRLRIKAPVFQLTEEFRNSGLEEFDSSIKVFTDAEKAYQAALLEGAITAKSTELEFWTNKVDVPLNAAILDNLVEAERPRIESISRIPTIIINDDGSSALGPWVFSPQKAAEHTVARRCCPLLLEQILRITEIRHRALSMKIEKKQKVAEKTEQALGDIEMKDVGTSTAGPSIQSLIDKGLNARLKKFEIGKKGGKKVTRLCPYSNKSNLTYTDYVWWEYGHQEELQLLLSPQKERSSFARFSKGEIRGSQSQSQASVQAKRQGKGGRKSQEGRVFEEGGQETREEVKAVRNTSQIVSRNLPIPLPDNLLTMSWDNAISYVLLNTPISFLSAGLFKNNVHCSTGVVVPPEIKFDLSLGLKYMFFQPLSKNLLKETWAEFQIKLRWRIYFLFKEGLDLPYDPDYAVHSNDEESTKPPILPQWMEMGLVMGRRYINKIASSTQIETAMATQTKLPFAPKVDRIYQFLSDNNYVVTMTDKNLGLAVSERDWLRRNELTLLEDARNYEQLTRLQADSIMSLKNSQMETLADTTEDHKSLRDLNVAKYFRSKLTDKSKGHIYPVFYGIPKIHKKPVGFRPIIPCHSVVFNPAAKFVSKELKPIIKSIPYIIHGTKELLFRMSQLRIDSSRKWFFVTGDVVAFYPNIPLTSCIEIVSSMYEDWLLSDSPSPNSPKYEELRLRLEIFKRAIEIGNTQLITQHAGKYYRQLNGLAMGVADSPDLSNCYGAHFETKADILSYDKVIFYGRYIDDCLGIIYAESANQALAFFKNKIAFDGCVIEWAVSEFKCQFLDVLFYKSFGKLEFKPFVKAGNNRERVPWVSHHPMDVKRGVYIGECSRLAVLCSNKGNYIEAIKDLNLLYVMRGYPEKLVLSWCKRFIQERWEKRFDDRTIERSDNVLVLKSRFDDVWNFFSATELGKTVTEYWAEWLRRAEKGEYSYDPARPFLPYEREGHDITDVLPKLFRIVKGKDGTDAFSPDLAKIGLLGSRWVVSRKRTKNLFDLTTKWKNAVFQKLDEAITTDITSHSDSVPIDSTLDKWLGLPLNKSGKPNAVSGNVILHSKDSDDEMEHPEFGRLSKMYT
jgi:hypothetical protein